MLYDYLTVSKIVRLDLHTHPIEALKDQFGIKGIRDIKAEVAAAVVAAIKKAGLNGIAITEHNNFNHSWVASLEILDNFRRENLIILPGAEIDFDGQQFVRLYIPDYYRRRIPFFKEKEWFLILTHPGYYNPVDTQQLNSLDFDAVEKRCIHGDFSLAESISAARNIPAIGSSDAHKFEDLGFCFTEMEMK